MRNLLNSIQVTNVVKWIYAWWQPSMQTKDLGFNLMEKPGTKNSMVDSYHKLNHGLVHWFPTSSFLQRRLSGISRHMLHVLVNVDNHQQKPTSHVTNLNYSEKNFIFLRAVFYLWRRALNTIAIDKILPMLSMGNSRTGLWRSSIHWHSHTWSTEG